MSGVQDKKLSFIPRTPTHFSGPAAESWVMAYMEAQKTKQRVEGNTLLQILMQRWPRHSTHDLANELLRAVNACEPFRIFRVHGDRSIVAAIALEKTS